MSIMARGGQIIANKFLGRICTVIVMSSGGALALIALWAIQRFMPNTIPTYAKILIYVLSTLQHCVRPLKKSLLMDYVPKKRRGIWNAVDSVTRFGWSGSAVLGGWIIHRNGYGVSFLYTGILQFFAALFLLVLLPLMPHTDHERKMAANSDVQDSRQ